MIQLQRSLRCTLRHTTELVHAHSSQQANISTTSVMSKVTASTMLSSSSTRVHIAESCAGHMKSSYLCFSLLSLQWEYFQCSCSNLYNTFVSSRGIYSIRALRCARHKYLIHCVCVVFSQFTPYCPCVCVWCVVCMYQYSR